MNQMAQKARGFFDALPAPLRRHLFGGLVWLTVAAALASFPAGVFYQQVKATGLQAQSNENSIKAVERDLGEIKSKQGILVERSGAAASQAQTNQLKNEADQRRTRQLLDEILLRLPSPDRGPRR